MAEKKDLYELGETPPLGHVPKQMYASLIRRERYGLPKDAFKVEVIDTPEVGPKDVLVYVMAAGVNYNNVWAAQGFPVDVIGARQRGGDTEDFHIGGSDASGIVWATGAEVRNVKVGDEVVLSCGQWDENAADIKAGADPITSTSNKIWGYETNYGSFAQFTRVQAHQCFPKPKHLTWEAAGAYMLVGATAYRMLMGWAPHTVHEGDPVLVWGATGGLGVMALQITRAKGGIPVAVVSDESKFEMCYQLGAKGVINRRDPAFTHWGRLPDLDDSEAFGKWMQGARAFGAKFWEVLGERKNPKIVFEHPGESTVPTSVFLADNAGMVVICAGTSGYNADVDLRYLWMRQKRLQGSHFANVEQCAEFNDMVDSKQVDPVLSKVFQFDETGLAHQLMHENAHPPGNMSILVNATKQGETTLSVS
ncbi:MAG: crotonyl-CoA carboxylase/reductase [Chloroflexi bacterium]|nr:crotonyl-CoA carboxylase/reductase [Chloroflexota bacterium]MDA1240041.1 crotonyl-CoA carboxylase/reductase [Chloroflexota bacterium]